MKAIYPLMAATLIFAASCNDKTNQAMSDNDMPAAPVAKKTPHPLENLGDVRQDDYYWMRLSDEQKKSATPDSQTQDVLNYLNAENAYCKEVMAHTEAFQNKLFEEMKGRIKEDDQSVPVKDNGYWYYTRYETGADYPLYCRKKDDMVTSTEEIIINGPERAKNHEFWALGGWEISEDNHILARSEDVLSRRIYTITFKNLTTGDELADVIEGVSGGATWANDNKTVFYVKKDPKTLREYQVWKHILGTPQSDDKLSFEEKDEEFSCFVYKSKSKKYLIIGSSQTLSTEYRVCPADSPDSDWRIINPREANHEYSVSHAGNKFYIVTNWNAKNFRLMECSENATTKENWKEIIPNRDDVLLEGVELFKDYMVIDERKAGLTQLRVMHPSDHTEHYMEFQDPAYAANIGANPEFDTKILRYGYTSLTTPGSTYDYDMSTKERKLLKQQEVVGGHNPEDYVSERVIVMSRSGVKVPVSIVYKKGTPLDGTAPLLLYGYGSYGASMDATFSSNRLSLLDRGFIYAIAHIRGGQEMGRSWYEDGKLLNKKNTFNDFIDCGAYLNNHHYCSKDKLFAMGGSAGGLLMGAVTNMQPGMWRGIVSAVPFVDVVTTMLDPSIPLTTFEWDEWGDPREKEYYDYMKSYSPYDNVEAKDYPNILITTGYWDSQVQYWEPAKYVAKMRELKTDHNILVMKCNMEAGHGGKSGRFESLKEWALEYAFILDLAGIKE